MVSKLSQYFFPHGELGRTFTSSISKKIGTIFVIILLLAAANVLVVREMLNTLNGVAETINVAGKLRMLSQKIAFETIKVMREQGRGKGEVVSVLDDFETALAALSGGGYAFGYQVKRLSYQLNPLLEVTRRDWLNYRSNVENALGKGTRTTEFSVETGHISDDAARMLSHAEALVSSLTLETQQAQARALKQMYALLFLDACVLFIVFVAARRKIVYPLRELAQRSLALAQKDQGHTQIPYRSHDEIDQLAEAYAHSSQRIGNLIIRIEKDKQDIQQTESMFRGLAENTVVGVYITQGAEFRFVNPKMAEMFLYDQDEMTSSVGVFDIVTADDRHLVEENIQRRLQDEIQEVNYERRAKRKDGSLFDVEVFGSKMEIDGRMATIGIMLDITERKRIDRALRVLIACNQALVRATDESTLLSHICSIVQKISGYPFVWVGYVDESGSKNVLPVALAEVEIGALVSVIDHIRWDHTETGKGVTGSAIRSGKTVISQDMQSNLSYAPWHAFMNKHAIVSAISLPLKAGHKILGTLTIYSHEADTFIPDEVRVVEEMADNLAYGIAALRADAARLHHVQQLEYFANHDVLTGLANRNCLSNRLTNAITTAHLLNHMVAVLLLDLDHFKVVNDSMGHAAGDALLQAVAGRLCSCVRDTDTVARLGGDEFVILIPDMVEKKDATAVARKILDALSQSFSIAGKSTYISTSIGISIYPEDGKNEETLLKNGDLAMYRAKQNGRANYHLYTEEINAHNRERHMLETELHYALSQGEFLLHYQPKINLHTRKIVGLEALVRWHHPELGLIPPSKFIPIAEETGLIIPLGTWVLKTACLQNIAWQRAGIPPVSVAVNLSARQFRHHDLVGLVKNILHDTGLAPSYLELELTESVIMQEAEDAVLTLLGLKALGVQLSLDDFGTGYSSLNYLRRFPLDNLKIDRIFVDGITSNSHDATIVKAVIALAHNLNLKVIAEGVEKKSELDFLEEHDCDEIQGFYFCKPLPPDELLRFLVAGHM